MKDKSEITTKQLKPSKENNTSNDMDEHEELFQCEICDVKTRCKESLLNHMQNTHRTMLQFDGLEDSGEKKDWNPALFARMQGMYQTLVNVESGGHLELDLVGVTVLLVISY